MVSLSLDNQCLALGIDSELIAPGFISRGHFRLAWLLGCDYVSKSGQCRFLAHLLLVGQAPTFDCRGDLTFTEHSCMRLAIFLGWPMVNGLPFFADWVFPYGLPLFL